MCHPSGGLPPSKSAILLICDLKSVTGRIADDIDQDIGFRFTTVAGWSGPFRSAVPGKNGQHSSGQHPGDR